MRYMLGCSHYPTKDAQGNCVYPLNLPDFWIDQVDSVLRAQRLYADTFGEPSILPPQTYTLCNGEFSYAEIKALLQSVGYSGPWDINAMIAAYNGSSYCDGGNGNGNGDGDGDQPGVNAALLGLLGVATTLAVYGLAEKKLKKY
jgi:hypothetical protein